MIFGSGMTKEYDEQLIEKLLTKKKQKRVGAKVFCVACGASKRTLRKWHNSYLCTDCFNIAQSVGDEHFIQAMKGKDASDKETDS